MTRDLRPAAEDMRRPPIKICCGAGLLPSVVDVADGELSTDLTLAPEGEATGSTPSTAIICFLEDLRPTTGLEGKRPDNMVRGAGEDVVKGAVALGVDTIVDEVEDGVLGSNGSSIGVFHNEPLVKDTAGLVVT